MSGKIYWVLRKTIQNIGFWIKKIIYRLIDGTAGISEYKSFRLMIVKYSAKEIVKGTLLSAVVLVTDYYLIRIGFLSAVDSTGFAPFIIGGIGIAGVILGLYCSNMSTIYSTRYANAPRCIANAFQYDRLTRKCISGIVDYIAFGIIVLSVSMIKAEIGWITVIISAVWSVAVIVSFCIAGNRTYQLSDIYSVADDSNRILYRIVTKRLHHSVFFADANFQNHFMKVAEKQIDILKSIQKYGESEQEREKDHTTLTEFMCKNLAIVDIYWKNKKSISKSSMWFRNRQKYQRWHLTTENESSLALRTGTALRTKGEHDYWWFENELFSINRASVRILAGSQDYESLYTYLLVFDGMCKTAILSKEANNYVEQVDLIRQEVEKCALREMTNEGAKKAFAGLVEVVSLLYLNLILETSKFYQEFNFHSIVSSVLKSIDKGDDYEKSLVLRRRGNKDFYGKIITEIKVEGKRITPDWVINQQVAKEEYVYMNSLLDIVREGMNHAFSLGKIFSDKGLHLEACIIFTRFYEYESKLSRLIYFVNNRKAELEAYHIDKALKWDGFRLNQLQNTMVEWKKEIPTALSKCSCLFALDTWKNSEDYPDFLGESYNHICEDAVEAIISDDIKQFSLDYESLLKITLLYQDYIKSDFVNKNNIYRIEYAYYIFTSPIVEWAQIGGLAVLWGEFRNNSEWKKRVCNGANSLFVRDGGKSDLPEKLIEYIQNRNSFMLGIGSRDILETGWKLRVANAIRERYVCESEYTVYGMALKTDSKLLKAFCPDFMDFGFTIDPAEVFWVICVNPNLPEEKRFKTTNQWDEEMLNV